MGSHGFLFRFAHLFSGALTIYQLSWHEQFLSQHFSPFVALSVGAVSFNSSFHVQQSTITRFRYFFSQMLQFQFGFSVHHFCFMYAIIIGTRPDGSRVLLNRPHGTALRVGTPVFRAIFLSFGASRRIRTIIYTFVEPSEWYQLQIAHSCIFLFFDFQPPTVVLSPRVERVPLPASPEAQSSVSEDGSDV